MQYDAFISYSHAADSNLAASLQSGLHRLAKPLYSLRALWIFRDKTSWAANPALWPAIQSALAQSRDFLLMASPEAARSKWIEREAVWWLTNPSVNNALLVLRNGELLWNDASGDFDWERSTALPQSEVGNRLFVKVQHGVIVSDEVNFHGSDCESPNCLSPQLAQPKTQVQAKNLSGKESDENCSDWSWGHGMRHGRLVDEVWE